MKAVLLDMDGTLIDTERVWMRVWDVLEREFTFTITYEDRLRFVGLPKQEFPLLCQEVLPDDVDFETFDARRAMLFEETVQKEGLHVKKGIFEFLEWCHEKQYLCAVVTSTFQEKARERLQFTGLLSHFDFVITGDLIHKGKPDPEIYELALKTIGVSANECIAIEDTYVGVLSAKQAKIPVYWMLDLIGPTEEEARLVQAVCEDFYDLNRRLEKRI